MGLEVSLRVILCLWLLGAAVADDCSTKSNCDACLQTRGCDWCYAPELVTSRCRASSPPGVDDWCADPLINPKDVEITSFSNDSTSKDIRNVYSQTRISPKQLNIKARLGIVEFKFQYRSLTQQNIVHDITHLTKYIRYRNYSQSREVDRVGKDDLFDVTMSFIVSACPARNESNLIEIHAGPEHLYRSNILLSLTLEVVCSCDCPGSREPVRHSPKCKRNGEWHCGACTCDDGWYGPTCGRNTSMPRCENEGRGDMNLDAVKCRATKRFGEELCSGRGTCECGKCKCNESISNHFDKFCTDPCLATADCALCLKKHNITSYTNGQGPCSEVCPTTLLDTADGESGHYQSLPLSQCFATDSDHCILEYGVMMINHSMPLLRLYDRNCSMAAAQVGSGAGVYVGGVVGALLVAGLAAGGLLLWKAMHQPRDFVASGGYDNMDAAGHRGENPLYRPPNSSFRNPLYQQTKKT